MLYPINNKIPMDSDIEKMMDIWILSFP